MSEAAAAVPRAGTVADRHVHPGTIALRFLKELPSSVLALPAVLAVMSDIGIAAILLVAAAMAVVMGLLNWLAWSRFRYGVGESDIVIEKGILSRTRRSIPFDRIQDVDIEQRLLARLFGLARVRIETGGSGQDEGLLDSVTMAEAERLRAAVRAGRRRPAAASMATAQGAQPVDEPESRLIFAMGLKRLLLFGLFNFSMVYLAGLFGLIQTFEQFLPFDIYDPARWAGLAEKSDLRSRFTPGAIATVLILALLLGLVAGMVRTLARDYGFRLHAEGRRLRRERGLTTRSEVVLGKSRLQVALVDTGPIRRRLGWFGLSFQSLGSGSDRSGRQSAAPFARQTEVAAILEEAGAFRLPDPSALSLVSRRHLLHSFIRLWLPAGGLFIASFWQPAALYILLLVVPLLMLSAWIARRSHRYGLAGDLLFVQSGTWKRRLWVVPLARVQALSVSRSKIQRWLDLATVRVDTAGAPLTDGVRIVDLRTGPARALAAEIARSLPAYSSGRKSGTDR